MDFTHLHSDILKTFDNFPPHIRVHVNAVWEKMKSINNDKSISKEERDLMMKRAQEDFNITIRNGAKDNK